MSKVALQAMGDGKTFHRILLEEYPEGVYVDLFIAVGESSAKDWLQEDWDMAKRSCEERFGIADKDWESVPFEGWHG